MTTTDPIEQLEHHNHPGNLVMSPAAAAPVQTSPLLKLPAELRNRIYEYAIEPKPRVASLRTRKTYNVAMKHTMRFTAEFGMLEPALLATCRTIRHEAMAEFRAHRPYKLVVSALGSDENELLSWRKRLSFLLNQSDTQASSQLDECDTPNLSTWICAIRWLQRMQGVFSHDRSVREMNKEFAGQEVALLCAVSKLTRDPMREPWDVVKGGSLDINTLIYGVQRSWRRDHWETMQRC